MNDRSADPLDVANDVAQLLADTGLHNVRNKNRAEQVQNEDGTWPITECVDCGDDMPEGRLKLGRIRCISCQERLEKSRNGYAKN